jgi:hypothetical protein
MRSTLGRKLPPGPIQKVRKVADIEPGGFVGAGGGDQFSIGREGRPVDLVGMPGQSAQQQARFGVPQSRCTVLAGGNDELSIGRKGGGVDAGRVPGQK